MSGVHLPQQSISLFWYNVECMAHESIHSIISILGGGGVRQLFSMFQAVDIPFFARLENMHDLAYGPMQ